MALYKLNVNGKTQSVEADADMPLLWVLRDLLGLTGSKFGCGVGSCGACTVMKDGKAVRSCQTPISEVKTAKIVTIEGLSTDGNHPLQKAWIEHDVPQCGYCQVGQIMSAAALLKAHPKPTEAQINEAMEGNLCRCGTYQRIKEAINLASKAGAR